MPIYKPNQKNVKFTLPSKPDFYVVLKGSFTYPDRKDIQKKAVQLKYELKEKGKKEIVMDLDLYNSLLLEKMIVDHNFENEKGQKLSVQEIVDILENKDAEAIIKEINKITGEGQITGK